MTDQNPQYEEDKVYLRDTRTGEIYLYERNLAANGNFESHVPNPSKKRAAAQDNGDNQPPANPRPQRPNQPSNPDASAENPNPAASKSNSETEQK